MSEISALAAANFLTKAALPLIKAAVVPQARLNFSLSSLNQDKVAISYEAKELLSHQG